jgi:hypothetical protein
MARTTLDDRARKSRIRERESRNMATALRKLDDITDEQIAILQTIKAAEATNTPVMASTIPDWRELRAMGAVREQDGVLVLSMIGNQVVSEQSKK